MRDGEEPIWVALLRISPSVQTKISGRHQLQAADVAAAVERVKSLTCAWDTDPERGRRAFVQTMIRGSRVLVVLYPTDEDGVWNLGSAYRVNNRARPGDSRGG